MVVEGLEKEEKNAITNRRQIEKLILNLL
jgi:hypothetical protein